MEPLGKTVRRDTSADHNLQTEITRLTFHNFAFTAAVSAVGTVGATFLLAWHFHDPLLWRLTAFLTIVAGIRIGLPLAFERRPRTDLDKSSAARWQLAHAVATGLNCSGIACSTLYNFRHHNYAAQFICTLGIFTLCAGIGASFGIQPWAAQLYGLLMLGSLAFSLFLTHDTMLIRMGCATIAIFALVYCKLVAEKYRMVLEQLRLKREMSHLAEHDALTGLANRRQFEAALAKLCLQLDPFAVLFLDLDGFKKINDTHGHATGDSLLQHVALRLGDAVRRDDLVSRLGGDEFAILHRPLATKGSVETLARHILETVSKPYSIDGLAVHIGTSIGIQLSAPGHNDPQRLLSDADTALYDVKQSGKGTFRFVESPQAVVITVPGAAMPDADPSPSRPNQNPRHRLGKLLIGVRQ